MGADDHAAKVGLLISSGSALLLVKRGKEADGKPDTWMVPTGKADGEDLQAEALREATERLGSLPEGLAVAGNVQIAMGKKGANTFHVVLSTVPADARDAYAPQLSGKAFSEWKWAEVGEVLAMLEAAKERNKGRRGGRRGKGGRKGRKGAAEDDGEEAADEEDDEDDDEDDDGEEGGDGGPDAEVLQPALRKLFNKHREALGEALPSLAA